MPCPELPGSRREKVGLMARYLTRDWVAVTAAALGPLALAAVLLP
jgi:hypothetical protein